MLPSFIAVDTETTGLDPEQDRVIELAAVRFEHGIPVEDFSVLLSPGDRALSPVARLITGITDAELAAAPPAADSLRAFRDFAGDLPLVAHNAPFDAMHVERALRDAGCEPLTGPWLDTLPLARTAWPEADNHKLESLATWLALPDADAHRALPDARRAGLLFVAAVRHLHATLPPEGWRRIARMVRGSAWERVFCGNAAPDATEGNAKGTGTAWAILPATPAAGPVEVPGRVVDETLRALRAETWLALETPPAADDDRAGLAAALEAARDGRRVLLAVPDARAWNTLRRVAAAHPEGARVVALSTPDGYVNRAALRRIADGEPGIAPLEDRLALLPLLAFTERETATSGGSIADARGFSPERARRAWSRVCCDAWDDDPAARAARDAAGRAGVLLATHATLCRHVARGGMLLPACDALVVTGAHRFPDALQADGAAGRTIRLFPLRECLQLLRPSGDAGHEAGAWHGILPVLTEAEAAEWSARWFEPDRAMQRFLQKLGRGAARQRPQGDYRVRYAEPVSNAFDADPEPLLAALRANEAFLADMDARLAGRGEDASAARDDLRRIAMRLTAFREDLTALCEANDAGAVHWVEEPGNPHRTALRAAPCDPSSFTDALRDLFGGGAFLSPALVAGSDPGRDAEAFLQAAGLRSAELPVEVLRVPADAARAPRLLATPFMPAPGGGDQALPHARAFVEALLPLAARGVLVSCPSQTAVRALHGALRTVLAEAGSDVPVWAQHHDGNRDALARLHAGGRGGFVLASEAIPGLRDADGNAPALWAILRMPLPPPRDPLLEARAELLRTEGRNARALLWHAGAVMRLKREWTSLCRDRPSPLPDICLLDARAVTEGLAERLAQSLGATLECPADPAALQAALARPG